MESDNTTKWQISFNNRVRPQTQLVEASISDIDENKVPLSDKSYSFRELDNMSKSHNIYNSRVRRQIEQSVEEARMKMMWFYSILVKSLTRFDDKIAKN